MRCAYAETFSIFFILRNSHVRVITFLFKLGSLVENSEPSKWQETLAILSTYGKSEDFPSLCLALGDRLNEYEDKQSATLCYMCALDLEKVSKYWMLQLNHANEVSGSIDLLALQMFIEKVTIFLHASDPSGVLEPDVADIFGKYAERLSAQGLLSTASKYCRSNSQSCNELRDRLFRSRDSHIIGPIMGSPPPFPFSQSHVGTAVVRTKTNQPQTNGTYHNNQQSYSQQNPATYQQPNNYQAPQESELPPGWIALQDPGSGNTYYANQVSGETCWEKPAVHFQEQTPMQSNSSSYHNQQNSHDQSQQQPSYDQSNQIQQSIATPNKLATKYGDGFVTSASHPELGEQYGNITTSNPYSGASRPGTAAVTPTAPSKTVPEAFDPNEPPPVSAEVKHISDGLLATVTLLSACIQTPNEKKQYDEINKGVGIFLGRVSRNEVGSDVLGKMDVLVQGLQNKDYSTATSIQKGLVNSDWREHKDWLKGLKFLCQLATKKL